MPLLPTPPAYVCLIQEPDPLITFSSYSSPLGSALKELFRLANITNYKIEPELYESVSCQLRDIPFSRALRELLETAQEPLVLDHPSGGSWTIRRRHNTPYSIRVSDPGPNARYSLKFTDIPLQRALTLLFLSAGQPYAVTVPLTGMVTTTLEGVSLNQAVKSLVRASPSPLRVNALPSGAFIIGSATAPLTEPVSPATTMVECKLEAVRVARASKSNRSSLLATTASGKLGTEMKSTTQITGAPAASIRLSATFRVIPLSDNNYEVTSSCMLSLPLTTTQKNQLTRLEKTFANTRQLKAGQTFLLDGMVLKEEQGAAKGGEEVLFFLTIKPL